MRITFHGAARQVTGSAHLLEIGKYKILLDCGLFDSDRTNPDSPNRQFTFEPRELDAVIVSHAHNDHIGRLPCVTRAGYNGPIFATPATGEILGIMLRDSARIQREDARGFADRHRKARPDDTHDVKAGVILAPPAEPLFELHDVEWLLENLKPVEYETPTEILPGITMTLHDAGHILGSASIQIDYVEEGKPRRFVFTGDLGRRDTGMMPDPTPIKDIDTLVIESTYGGRELANYETLIKQLHAIVARATRLQSKIVIPAFSLGRTQRLVYCFQELFEIYKVKPIPIHVDSPLSSRLTDVHRDYKELFAPAARKLMDKDREYFGFEGVQFCGSWDESRRLNYLPGPRIIIASSGMCDAGRIRHHLRHIVEDPDNAVVIVSYQAENSLGRQIADGAERIQIMDQWHDLNAAVYVLDGFSGHADKNDLAWWLKETGGNIGHGFIVHGDPDSMEALRPVFQEQCISEVIMPERLSSYEV